MVLLAGCPGLRVSEIGGLKWCDFDNLSLLVQRSRVHGKDGDVKTEYQEIVFRLTLHLRMRWWTTLCDGSKHQTAGCSRIP